MNKLIKMFLAAFLIFIVLFPLFSARLYLKYVGGESVIGHVTSVNENKTYCKYEYKYDDINYRVHERYGKVYEGEEVVVIIVNQFPLLFGLEKRMKSETFWSDEMALARKFVESFYKTVPK